MEIYKMLFYAALELKGIIERIRAFFIAWAISRWCLAQLPDILRGMILPRSVIK